MADDKTTRSKLSEKDHRKDTEDEDVRANISDTSGDAGAVTPDLIGGVSSAENEGELKQSESGSSIHLDAHTTFKEVEKKSGFDLEIDTNMEGLEEEMYKVAQRNRKGKAKLEEEEGKELDDDPEVESNIERLVKEIRELYRQVTKGTKGKLERLMKSGEEYTSEDEESESESELYRKCEMLLKTPLGLMLELDTEIRGLVEELEELITSKDDKAGPKLRALRAELEALKESNYHKEVEVIGMVKGLIIDDGSEEKSVIDAVVYSGVGPMVEEAKERIARVRLEIEEVESNKSVRGIAASSGGEIEYASEIQSSETEMPLKTDDDEKSGFDLEIDTNIEGLEEEMYELVAQRVRKGKAKLEEEGKELDDDPEVESNIEGPVRAMRELYRKVTKGTEGKLERLVNREEYTSEDEESESELELHRKCEMLLKTPLSPMLEVDTEIRGLLEELEKLITSKDVKAGRKLPALRAELEALQESNYQKEVEVIGMVKGLIIDDGAEEKSVIDAAVYSGVGPVVEEAKERIARVRLEIEEVEMDRNKSFGCCGGLNVVDFLLNWK